MHDAACISTPPSPTTLPTSHTSTQSLCMSLQVVGGWSRLLRDYIRMQLLSTECGLMTTGLPIELGDQHCLIWARLCMLISDGDGLRIAMDWNGQGAMKPCFRHWNVISKDDLSGRGRLQHAPDEYVDITEHDSSKFKLWPRAEFEQAADLLVVAEDNWRLGGMPAARLVEMRKALGFQPSRDSLLVCPQLRPHIDLLAVFRYDWVHTFCSGGVLSTALWQLVHAAEQANVATQADISTFLKEPWCTPLHRKAHRQRLPDVFNEHWAAANRKGNTIKCTSSELMELYGLMRYWALTRLPRHDELTMPLQLFLKVSKCVDIIVRAKRKQVSMVQASTDLRQCLQGWMVAHKAAFGSHGLKPKSHWAFDVADQLATDPVIVDAFVVERLHLRVRAAAEHVRKLEGYERTVLSRVLNDQARALQIVATRGLIGVRAPFPGLPSATVSDRMEVDGVHVAVGDFVRRGQDTAKVVACAEEGGVLLVVVDLQVVAHTCSPRSSTYTLTGDRSVWPANDISEVVAWKDMGQGQTLVLVE